MQRATITIKKLYDNGPNKPGKIIDTVGGEWKIWSDVLEQLNLKEGFTYELGYKPGEYKGKPDNTIKGAIEADIKPVVNGHAQQQSIPARNDHPSGPMGLANAFVAIGAVALDEEAIANAIIKCRKGHKKGWAVEV